MLLMDCWEGKSNSLLSMSPPPSSDSVRRGFKGMRPAVHTMVEVARMKDVQGERNTSKIIVTVNDFIVYTPSCYMI